MKNEGLKIIYISLSLFLVISVLHFINCGDEGGEGGQTSGVETPGVETPAEETSGAETPGEETSGAETPAEETSGAETFGEESVEESVGPEVHGECWDGPCPKDWHPDKKGENCVYNGDTVTFKGTLIEFGSDDKKIKDAKVYLYENDNEGRRYPVCTTSGSNGEVELKVPKKWAKIGLMATKSPLYKDTYQFHLKSTAQDETLWIVKVALYKAAPALAGVILDDTKAVTAGAIYFVNDKGVEEPVGCATVESDLGGDVRYFNDDGLPTKPANQNDTNPKNGYFLVANIPAGSEEEGPKKVAITAKDKSKKKIGDTFIWTYPNSICIGNIYTYDDIKTNPTCK